MYLLFGNDRALLLDTGATADPERFPLRRMVDRLVDVWLAKNPREGYALVVAHTHGHGDHVAGDAQFAGRARHHSGAQGRGRGAVVLRVRRGLAGPDRLLRPGRAGAGGAGLAGPPPARRSPSTTRGPPFCSPGTPSIPDGCTCPTSPRSLATMDRMVAFAGTRPVTHVLGCHVEMTSRPGRDFPLGATYQPGERALQMTAAQLIAVRDAAVAVAGQRGSPPVRRLHHLQRAGPQRAAQAAEPAGCAHRLRRRQVIAGGRPARTPGPARRRRTRAPATAARRGPPGPAPPGRGRTRAGPASACG